VAGLLIEVRDGRTGGATGTPIVPEAAGSQQEPGASGVEIRG